MIELYKGDMVLPNRLATIKESENPMCFFRELLLTRISSLQSPQIQKKVVRKTELRTGNKTNTQAPKLRKVITMAIAPDRKMDSIFTRAVILNCIFFKVLIYWTIPKA